MFKLLLDYANNQEGLPGYMIFVRLKTTTGDKVIAGVTTGHWDLRKDKSARVWYSGVSEDGMSVLILTRGSDNKFTVPTVVHASQCIEAWIEF